LIHVRMLYAAFFVLILASAAGAAITEVPSPFADPVCREIDSMLADMRDPTALYIQAKNCPATCRKAEKDCEQYAKVAAACWRALSSDTESYAKQNCVTTYPASNPNRKACLGGAGSDDQARRAEYAGLLASTITFCQGWGTNCETTCTPP